MPFRPINPPAPESETPLAVNPPPRKRGVPPPQIPDREKPDYEIGYGKPPERTRFKKGQSGNPKGRPRGAKGMNTIVRDLLTRKVAVRTPEGPKKMSRIEALFHKLIEKGFAGDTRAIELVAKHYQAGVPDDIEQVTDTDFGISTEQEGAALAVLVQSLRAEIRAEEQGEAQ
jgi:hypothetical protein